MKGDFSRFTFRPGKRYTSVRLQQGRVTLDSDWNEQAAIREDLERVRFEDIVGTSAVPCREAFSVRHRGNGLTLSAGRIYAGGLACELDEPTPLEQLLRNPLTPAAGRTDFLYLDAWERHLTAVDDPELLEPALGGADTTTRLKVAWRIGVVEGVGISSCSDAASLLPQQPNGLMSAAAPGGYKGAENRLYRVEIHGDGAPGSATFKWSRDNGFVAFVAGASAPGRPSPLPPTGSSSRTGSRCGSPRASSARATTGRCRHALRPGRSSGPRTARPTASSIDSVRWHSSPGGMPRTGSSRRLGTAGGTSHR